MKTLNLILSAGVAGGLFAGSLAWGADTQTTNAVDSTTGTNAPEDAAKAPPPGDAPPPADAPSSPDDKSTPPAPPENPPNDQLSSTNTVVDPVTGELKLRIQFRNASLETVLDYMSNAAGYIIHPRVPISGKVTVWSENPLSKEEALKLVKKILDENGYTVLQDGRILTIIKSADAKVNNIPVIVGNIPTNIPVDEEIVTQIIPVRSLNAVSLVKDLQPLLPMDTTLIANETGNSLIMTDTQANIHRIAEIVRGLDSVSSSSATIIVFPLKYADAKSVASLIKDLFPSTTTSTTGGFPGGGFPGGFGGFGRFQRGGEGGGASPASDTGSGHTPTSRVTATSDDHANALVVSVPDDLVPTIKQLITSLDTDIQDMTELRTFVLKHADPIELATELGELFPDDSKDDNSQFSARFRFGFFGAPPQPAANANESDRVKRLNRVMAVADPRTHSLMVSASKDMMPQIALMIEGLDASTRNIQHAYVYTLTNAEVFDVQPVLQDLFSSGNKSSSSSSGYTLQTSPLYTRSQSFQSSANSSTAQPFGSTTGNRAAGGGGGQ